MMVVLEEEDFEDQIEAARDLEPGQESEEEGVIEVHFEEAEKEVQSPWIITAYQMRFGICGLFEDMAKAWGLRQKMEYKVLKGSLFLIEFSTEGDFNFALRGGPWLHKGGALIIAPFDVKMRPSEVKLESIPLWVQIHDLPQIMMTEKMGHVLGNRLGLKVIEVDVETNGRNVGTP